ncbi:MAG: hypothetical protein RIT45_1279 [Pseudomonadota bacterium]
MNSPQRHSVEGRYKAEPAAEAEPAKPAEPAAEAAPAPDPAALEAEAKAAITDENGDKAAADLTAELEKELAE